MTPSVLTLGTFDGVHRGHQAILRQVVGQARRRGARSVVLAFGMPPRFAKPDHREPVLLTTWEEKRAILKTLGIDRIEILTFNRKTASTSAEDFFAQTIVKKWRAAEMIVGPRIAFGKNRGGQLPVLRRLGRQSGVRIRVVKAVPSHGEEISSRRIRTFLAQGDVEKAAALLGRSYCAQGKVVHGDHRGRKLGYPTANIAVPREKILPLGVFWVKVQDGSRRIYDGLCNVGIRPTFTPNEKKVHFEVYLLNRSKNLYGRRLVVHFMKRIRPEKRFDSSDALKKQIAKDFIQANQLAKKFPAIM